MSRICGYAKTTTGYPCTQVVKDSRDHCEAGHPCPIVFDMATVTNRLPLANAMPMETDDFVLPRLHSRPAPSFLTAKYVLTEGSVFHVGTFDLSTKGAHGDLEGRGLSVSLVPDAWRSIARLGDAPEWRLSKSPPGRFLDALALRPCRPTLEEWGFEHGLVEQSEMWVVKWYDDELDDEVSFLFETEEEAIAEQSYRDDAQPLEHVMRWTQTGKLYREVGRTLQAPSLAYDDLCIVAARAAGLDGVWWEEDLDEAVLSAPRAVILPERVSEWVAARESDFFRAIQAR